MRRETIAKIDALHERIAKLIKAETDAYDKAHPDTNAIIRQIEHTRLQQYRHCPGDRNNMRWATASFPTTSW